MGQNSSCEKCPTAINHSVVTFSEPLVLKLTEGTEPEPLTEEELRNENNTDLEWFEKLKCIDDSHTDAYGLTPQNFEQITKRIEKITGKRIDSEPPCDLKQIIDCYKKTPECSIKCSDAAKKYKDCIEGKGLKTLASKTNKTE